MENTQNTIVVNGKVYILKEAAPAPAGYIEAQRVIDFAHRILEDLAWKTGDASVAVSLVENFEKEGLAVSVPESKGFLRGTRSAYNFILGTVQQSATTLGVTIDPKFTEEYPLQQEV